MITAKNLLKKGFLPKEFPGLFNSDDFDQSLRISDEILESKPTLSLLTRTSIPKGAGFRRNIGLPNPKHYTKLAKFLEEKSTEIDRFLNLSNISMSKTICTEDAERAIVNEHNFEELIQEKILKGYSSKYMLVADISKFYNTIYTHSIPWALHGKLEAKKDRTDALWGNKLDRLVRNMQDGQTLGVPIGPDSSRLISEIIGVALDKIINNSTNNLNGIRFVDDYYFFTDTFSEAESLSIKINRALNAYELTANEAKSNILSMPAPIERLQLQVLKNFKIRKSVPEQKVDVIHLYNIAIDIHAKNPIEAAFHYFLAKISPIKIHEENWKIVESILLQIALAETSTITMISKILISYKSYNYNLNLEKIKVALLKIIQLGVQNNFAYEICWSFWALVQLEIQVNTEINSITEISDGLAIISILTAREKGFYTPNLDMKYWNNLIAKDSLYDSNWMLSYEAEQRGWLQNQNGLKLIEDDSYFNQLKKLNISFLNMNSVINPIDEGELLEETDLEQELNIFQILYGI